MGFGLAEVAGFAGGLQGGREVGHCDGLFFLEWILMNGELCDKCGEERIPSWITFLFCPFVAWSSLFLRYSA